MAKVKSPLHSQSARGAFGHAVIYRQSPAGQVAVRYVPPGAKEKFTPSAAQLAQRDFYGHLVEAWRGLSAPDKAIYNDAGFKVDLNGWQYFVSIGGLGIVLPHMSVFDTFTDDDDTLLTDHVPDYDILGYGWMQGFIQTTDNSGSGIIEDNELVFSVDKDCYVIDSGQSNVLINVLFHSLAAPNAAFVMVIRYESAGNTLFLTFDHDTREIILSQVVADVVTTLQTVAADLTPGEHAIRVELLNDSIRLYHHEVLFIDYETSVFLTAVKHGLGVDVVAGGKSHFDNYKIEPLTSEGVPPPEFVIHDLFTDDEGTSIFAHVPDVDVPGGGWIFEQPFPLYNAGGLISATNSLSMPTDFQACMIDSGIADATITFTLDNSGGSAALYYLFFRQVSALNNHFACFFSDAGFLCHGFVVDGVPSFPDVSPYTFPLDIINVRLDILGDSIKLYMDDVLYIDTTDSQFLTGTKCGIGRDLVTAGEMLIDNFAVKPLGT